MKYTIHKAEERGHLNFGWLDTYHSFSFGQYYNPEKIHFGALRVLNDDFVAKGAGFSKHPHDNMEIITIPLQGALAHEDTTGGKGVIEKYDVQVMSAGSGLQHSEFNHSKTEDVQLLQIWVFPRSKNITPRYDQKTYLPEERINKLQLIVAPDTFDTNALQVHQDTWFSLANFDKNQQVEYKFYSKNSGLYLFVIEGTIEINGTTLSRRDAIGISETDLVNLTVTEKAELLFMEVPMHLN